MLRVCWTVIQNHGVFVVCFFVGEKSLIVIFKMHPTTLCLVQS